jgi:hypothetical protein
MVKDNWFSKVLIKGLLTFVKFLEKSQFTNFGEHFPVLPN